MKRVIGVMVLLIGMSLFVDAQINPRALGLRLGGDGAINGAEISYQQAWGEANRIELDLGFGGGKNHSRMFLAGIYHWHWNINGGLNWYAGPGASLGIYTYDSKSSYLNVAVGGQIGIEYDFNTKGTPILLSLDIRPMWDFLGDHAGFGWGSALGIRYVW
jgi:hypothetical protein